MKSLRKISVAVLAAAALLVSACSATQIQKAQTNIQTFVTKAEQTTAIALSVGCQLDNKYVPLGQSVAPQIAALTGIGVSLVSGAAAGTAASGVVVAATNFDKVTVHPAVVAMCTALLGSGAQVVGEPALTSVVPAEPAPAAK